MRAAACFLFLLMLLPGGATAGDGSIFEVLNMSIFDGDVKVGGVYSDGCNHTYSETWGTVRYPGHRVVAPVRISASIDITGFNGMVVVDGDEYVCGCPSDLAIISQGVTTGYAGFEANKDWVKRDITIVSEGGNTTATMVVTFMWHWTTYSSVTNSCKKHYRLETKTVSDTKPHPKILSIIDHNVFAQITMHNNSFDPYTLVQVDVPKNITVTTFAYKNITAKHFHSVGVMSNSCVEYVDSPMWKVSSLQDIMIPCGDICLIREAPLNLSDLQIQISTPYHTVNVTNCTITTITGNSTDYINFKGMFVYITLISLCLMCAGMNVRRLHQ